MMQNIETFSNGPQKTIVRTTFNHDKYNCIIALHRGFVAIYVFHREEHSKSVWTLVTDL